MTTHSRNLGRFVVARSRQDGTDTVRFVVPGRLRPVTWPPVIALPEFAPQTGSLGDPVFAARVIADAKRLNDRFDVRRTQASAEASTHRNLPNLLKIHYNRPDFKQLSSVRQLKNQRSGELINQWSNSRGNPLVEQLSEMDVDDFLSAYDHQDAKRIDLKSLWSSLFKTAIYAGWIKATPLARGHWKRKECAKVKIWKEADVAAYSQRAMLDDEYALAALIRTLFLTGQRIGDMRTARWGHEFNGERFLIRQSKTKKMVNLPVPNQVRTLLQSVRVAGSDFVFTNPQTGTGFTHSQISQRFACLREQLCLPGEAVLTLKALRHSCVHQMDLAGASAIQIAGVTGHLLARVYTILDRYSPDRAGSAEAGMKKRHVATGGSLEDFGDLGVVPPEDWVGTDAKVHFFDPSAAERVVPTDAQLARLKEENWSLYLLESSRRERTMSTMTNRELV